MKEKFTLFHIALYSKGWYRHEFKQDIWADLRIIFELDDYNGEFMTNSDMVHVLLNHCQALDDRGFQDLVSFASGIDRDNSWKFGYYTKGCRMEFAHKDLPEWDYYEAIVRYCLSVIRFCDKKTLCGEGGNLPMPDYKNGLAKGKGISKKRIKEHFVKDI